MRINFALTFLLVLAFNQVVSGQCDEDTNFVNYHCLYPEMLEIDDSLINIRIVDKPFRNSLKYYQFMYNIDNDQINQKQTKETLFARQIMRVFITHQLTINCKPFTGTIRITQKYRIWGVENQHSGNAIREIKYEKGRIIKTEIIPDPTVDPAEERKMW